MSLWITLSAAIVTIAVLLLVWTKRRALSSRRRKIPMQGLKTLVEVSDGLQRIALAPLARPDVSKLSSEDDRTEALILWGVGFYAYSVIAHLRVVLRGLVLLAENGNLPATFVLSRHVFEWAAQVCYVNENLEKHISAKDWKAARELLDQVVIGGKWIKEHGHKYGPIETTSHIPDTLRLKNALMSYEAYLKQVYGTDAKDDYGLLSEYSHPNAVCLQQYHDGDVLEGDFRFTVPTAGSPLPHANWCLVDLIKFLLNLLRLSGDQGIRSQLEVVATRLAQLASGKRRT